MKPRYLFVQLLLALCLVTSSAFADVVPIRPGSMADGRPLLGTTQNLPPMVAKGHYFAGPGLADEVTAYYQSEQALKDQTDIASSAQHWTRQWLSGHCPRSRQRCRGLVLFDIDETLLSNYDYYANESPPFSFNQDHWNAFTARCGQTPITPVVELFQWLRQRGVNVVLLSGRSTALQSETAQCLVQRGISDGYRLILKSPLDTEPTAAAFKAKVRRQLEREGYTIIASLGDQVSDMSFGYLKKGFLLPNLMYFIP
jgi:predicted secreted acid phosphatase